MRMHLARSSSSYTSRYAVVFTFQFSLCAAVLKIAPHVFVFHVKLFALAELQLCPWLFALTCVTAFAPLLSIKLTDNFRFCYLDIPKQAQTRHGRPASDPSPTCMALRHLVCTPTTLRTSLVRTKQHAVMATKWQIEFGCAQDCLR